MIFIFLAFASLCICPPLASNPAITKLCLCTFFLCFAEKGSWFKLELPVKFFLLWLAIATIGSFNSEWPMIALHGFHLRYEGLFTFLILSIMAWLYWSKGHGEDPMIVFLILICLALPIFKLKLLEETYRAIVLTPVAQGSLFCVIGAILYASWRPLALLAMPGLLQSGCRSGLLGFVGAIICCEILKNSSAKGLLKPLGLVLLILGSVVALSPLGSKLAHTRLHFDGARTQWMRQSMVLMRYEPLLGYGLDTGSKLLTPAHGQTGEKDVISDRTHNIFFDAGLFTGFFGIITLWYSLVSAFWLTYCFPSNRNIKCLSGLVAFVISGCINPLGIPAIALALICLFGIRK